MLGEDTIQGSTSPHSEGAPSEAPIAVCRTDPLTLGDEVVVKLLVLENEVDSSILPPYSHRELGNFRGTPTRTDLAQKPSRRGLAPSSGRHTRGGLGRFQRLRWHPGLFFFHLFGPDGSSFRDGDGKQTADQGTHRWAGSLQTGVRDLQSEMHRGAATRDSAPSRGGRNALG